MLARIVLGICMSLWLGGIAALFVFVSHLFKVNRDLAVVAAPEIFKSFATYQLALAGIAVMCALACRKRWLLAIAALGALAAACMAFLLIPAMESIRLAGQSGTSPRFRNLHAISMLLFMSQAALLLLALIMMSWRREAGGKAAIRSSAKDFPA